MRHALKSVIGLLFLGVEEFPDGNHEASSRKTSTTPTIDPTSLTIGVALSSTTASVPFREIRILERTFRGADPRTINSTTAHSASSLVSGSTTLNTSTKSRP